MNSSIRAETCGFGQRTGLFSTSSKLGVSRCKGIAIECTLSTHAVIFTPTPKNFRATAPAATRPIVSRAELLPPPRGSRKPYLASYVKSACDGRQSFAISE